MIDKQPFEGHTAGPWVAEDLGWENYVTAPNGRTIAGGEDHEGRIDVVADLNLIAAAPTLLLENQSLVELVRAQQELIDWLDGGAMVGDFSIRARVNELKRGLGLEP